MVFKNNFESGQSLFEMVFAFGIMALIVVAIVGLATISVRNSSYSKNKTLADKYANQLYEYLRQQRDKSWSDFKAKAPSTPSGAAIIYCVKNLSYESPSIPNVLEADLLKGPCDKDNDEDKIANTILFRDLTLKLIALNEIEAEIRVHWTDSKGEHESNLITHFVNW